VVAGIANLESFNHVIVYLPEDDLWLDGTAAGHDPFLPPGIDQGAAVMVVRGAESVLETTPVVGAGGSRLRYTLSRGSDGAVAVVVWSEDTGDAASRRRGALAGSNDPRRFARWLQRQFPGAELTAEPVYDLQPSRDPVFMELSASVPRAVLLSGGGIPTSPVRLDLLSRLVPSGQRQTPLWVTALPGLEWTLEVRLERPPGPLPEGVRLDTPYGFLNLELEATGSGYRVEGEFRLATGLVPSDETGALRDFLREAERHLSRPLEVP
jgi:hypothetical protein